MKRSWPAHALAVVCCLFVPGCVFCQSDPLAVAAASGATGATSVDLSRADVPSEIQDLIRSAQQRYLQGSDLIKSGESAKARIEFNKAVDILLESQWNIASNRELSRYFQDLVRRIQQDESLYLLPQEPVEELPEKAVVDELSKLDLIPIKIDPSLKDSVEADLANAKYDIPITLNEPVLQSLNFWLNRGRKYFSDGLQRSGRYKDMIEKVFREESIPLDIMYLAQVESLFKTNALSRARAKGMWQFGRWTAVRYGLRVNSYVDERSDPEKSTRAAARYLNDLYAMFKDWNLVLAAYNWGEGKVQKLIDRSGVNDFWELTGLRRRNFPKETKNHVPLIQASVILARNPEKYGFSRDLDPPDSYDLVTVSRPIDLRAAAKLLGISLEELKGLNPALRGLSTPADYPDFQLKVPAGSEPDICQTIAELPAVKFRPPAFDSPGRYRVRPGDTLGKIAARYHVPVRSLEEANDIRSPKALRVGSIIRVPAIRSSSTRTASAHAKTSPKRIASNQLRPGNISSKKSSAASTRPPKTTRSRTASKPSSGSRLPTPPSRSKVATASTKKAAKGDN